MGILSNHLKCNRKTCNYNSHQVDFEYPFEEDIMSKSIFTTLTDLAKGSLVTTTGAAQVDMGQPEQVKTAQQAARVRASKIRMNSPTAAMPKSMKKKGIKYEGAEKSASALSDLVRKSEDFDMAAFNRENPVFERDERNVPLKTYDQKISPPKGAKKPSSAVAERKMKSTRTKKAFTMLPPGKAKGSESPTPTVKRKPSRPSADQQAYRMKSASKKKT